MPDPSNNKEKILQTTKNDRSKTVNELFEKSQPSSSYYTFLILAVLIIACGLLLDNAFIVIGGMLVAPVLTPIFVVALSLAVGETKAVGSASWLLLKSFLIVVTSSLFLAFLFDSSSHELLFENTMRTALLYFIIATASGAAATFSWVKKETAEILPGVAIAVSLVPPLSLVGIRLANLDSEIARFYFLIFFFNLIGLLVGSHVAFTLLKFYRSGREVKKEAEEYDEENHRHDKPSQEGS